VYDSLFYNCDEELLLIEHVRKAAIDSGVYAITFAIAIVHGIILVNRYESLVSMLPQGRVLYCFPSLLTGVMLL